MTLGNLSDQVGVTRNPSQAQLDHALQRGLPHAARFEIADATSLPAVAGSIDVAVAALVVHFMPDPVAGVREVARVTRPGGLVAAYAWTVEDSSAAPQQADVGVTHEESSRSTEASPLYAATPGRA